MEQILINFTPNEDNFTLSIVTPTKVYTAFQHDEKCDAIMEHLQAVKSIITEE